LPEEAKNRMWYVPVLIVVLAAGTIAGVTRFGSRKQPGGSGTETVSVVSLSMDQIHFLLAKLKKEEAPESVCGAMCYSPMEIPFSAEYICPVCGEKTIYTGNQSAFFQWELGAARRLAESIDSSTAFSVVLDESEYCEFCCENGSGRPVLVLRVTHEEGEETANSVSVTDLRMLNSFLQGSLFWVTSNDGQEPLRDHVGRMAELLGI